MIDTWLTPKLREGFERHLMAMSNGILPQELRLLWQDIACHYSEPVRVYHTLCHLDQLFVQFNQLQQQLKQPSIIALALFYHDIIYDPTRTDNELRSAEHASKVLRPYLPHKHIARIDALIMMSAQHELTDKQDTDAAYLLDMDLSILGSAWAAYQHYLQAVRQEYSHIKDKDYRVGRTAVLKKLLAHSRLYLTPEFAPLERQARKNIKREIDCLQTTI